MRESARSWVTGWAPGASRIVVIAALLVAVVGAILAADRWTTLRAIRDATDIAGDLAAGSAGLLQSELQKFRLLPLVLADTPDTVATLANPTEDATTRLNERLALLAERTDAAVIYLLDANGLTRAASNSTRPDSFVGQDLRFRPYFREALGNGAAEMFALGTTSGRAGLYLARRVGGGDAPLGVIVVKVEFDAVERQWADAATLRLVTDRNGVVIVTGAPAFRFRAIGPIDAQSRQAIRDGAQFGASPLLPLDYRRREESVWLNGQRYVEVRAPAAMHGATLHALVPWQPAQRAAAATARVALLTFLFALGLLAIFAWRQHERRQLIAQSRAALKREVAERTAELQHANTRLTRESRVRNRLDQRYRLAREELAQASRLGTIGQITSGVVHEIAQPVAAIRGFADNARILLERDERGEVDANLSRIVSLTERIGLISAELRDFARRRVPPPGPVPLGRVVDGALMLLGDRLRSAGTRVEVVGQLGGIRVFGDRVRLEQVFVNLIQNAADATAPNGGHIRIALTTRDPVGVVVADDGPGLAPDVAARAFTPFVSGREDGLGLGLGIARDIAREYGGDLRIAPSPLGGAAFLVELKSA